MISTSSVTEVLLEHLSEWTPSEDRCVHNVAYREASVLARGDLPVGDRKAAGMWGVFFLGHVLRAARDRGNEQVYLCVIVKDPARALTYCHSQRICP
jgi:hypothetical protein